MRIGADSGGTFTDVVAEDGRILKVPSTPEDPGSAVRSGLEGFGSGGVDVLSHGTTVATNALLERRGARVALVTTAGFADVIEIARQNRPSLYDPWADRPAPLVARVDRIEVPERVGADGVILESVDTDVLD
ncbi:MAG: hydantoinase/oxoprolinase N-terminal domain-containing protein, partial [Acidimicrobiales bacterium]